MTPPRLTYSIVNELLVEMSCALVKIWNGRIESRCVASEKFGACTLTCRLRNGGWLNEVALEE